jgi:hypothetical protein
LSASAPEFFAASIAPAISSAGFHEPAGEALGVLRTQRSPADIFVSGSSATDFSRVALASALGHLGQVDEARRIWAELKEINPKYSFSTLIDVKDIGHELDARDCTDSI